jgi:hypothetical protein
MRSSLRDQTIILAAATVFAAQSTAGEKAKPEPKKSELQPLLSFVDGKVVFDVQEKMRVEIRDNNFDFNSAVNGPQDASWLLQRFRFGIGYQPLPWLKFYIQGQDVREIGGERPNTPGVLGAEGDDIFDILKAYVQLGDPKKGPSATVGRQFLAYGDQRLIGPLEWLNQARAFDAIKLRYVEPKWHLDLFTASPLVYLPYKFDRSQVFDIGEPASAYISGAYLATQFVPFNLTTDLYVFNKRDQGTPDFGAPLGDSDFWTIGTLWKGDPKKLHNWDYTAEMAFQTGQVSGRDLTAFAGHWEVGYNFIACLWKPRIGLQYNYATGDDNPADTKIQTFQNLYPTNHLFYGYMDTTGWINMHNPQLNISVMPTPKLKLMLDYHAYWNASNDDAWYRVNGVTRVRTLNAAARNASSFRGHEIDFTASCKLNAHVGFMGGYSHFFAGNYLADTGASDDANFAYVQVQFDF